MEENTQTYPYSQLSLEETLRQRWLQTFDTPFPSELGPWLKELIQQEVAHARMADCRLDDATLAKARDGRRLSLTRLDHVETEITETLFAQMKLRRFLTVNSELGKQQAHLYELNKRQAQLLTEQRELERYQAFEAVNGRFQRIVNLRKSIAFTRQQHVELSANVANTQRAADEAEKRTVIEKAKVKESEEALVSAALMLNESTRLRTDALVTNLRRDDMREQQAITRERLEMMEKAKDENSKLQEEAQRQLAQLMLKRQSLEVHSNLIEHAEGTMVRLKVLQDTIYLRDNLKQQLSEAIRNNNERNEQLRRLFSQSQEIEDSIQTLNEEVAAHRSSIAGQDSYNLQRRVTDFHGRHLMLKTAASLWRSIALGYNLLEEKRQQTAALRLKNEHLSRTIDEMEVDVRRLEKQLDEKTVQLTVAKTQNIIELREDLQEGTPCVLCGAVHHPWYGETVSEQNALIASLKLDCELMGKDLDRKRRELSLLKMDMATTNGQLDSERKHIEFIEKRQSEDTTEWQLFSQLDRSFAECSSSTNREARASMIQQLIDKNDVDMENAEKELNAFNFHMDAINNLSSRIQQRQQEANDLSVRLNEVNTACQVMAGQVERFTSRLNNVNQDFSRYYDALDKIISLPDWFPSWTSAPESLNLRIQEMAEQWKVLNIQIHNQESRLDALAINAEQLNKVIALLQADLQRIDLSLGKLTQHVEVTNNDLQQLEEGRDMMVFFTEKRDALTKQRDFSRKTQDAYVQTMVAHLSLQSQILNMEEITHYLERNLADERSELDMWMQHYNTSHPPVQMAELERLLANGKSWEEVRKNVKDLTEDYIATRARLDFLRADIIAMQSDGVTPIEGDGNKELESLRRQVEDLELKRKQVLQQLGHYEDMLLKHEKTC